MCELLLGAGASANALSCNSEGITSSPLFAAAANGRPRLVQLLLAHGANPHLVDRMGRTPDALAEAVLESMERTPGIALLMGAGADHPEVIRQANFYCGRAGMSSPSGQSCVCYAMYDREQMLPPSLPPSHSNCSLLLGRE